MIKEKTLLQTITKTFQTKLTNLVNIFVGDLLWIEDINHVKILHKPMNRRTPFYNYNNAFNTKIKCLRKFNLEFT